MKKLLLYGLISSVIVGSAYSGEPENETSRILDWKEEVLNPESFLNQGWSDEQVELWYGQSQGSRLMPLSWLLALEMPGSMDKFMGPENVELMQYIPTGGQLPLGFVVDEWSDASKYGTYSMPTEMTGTEWIGLNCAACHTGRFTYQNEEYFVHGAPTMADFMMFTNGVLKALAATLSDDQKFERFAKDVLKSDYSSANHAQLKKEVEGFHLWRDLIHTKNGNISNDEYGYARLDAVGHIFNQVSLLVHNETDLNPDQLTDEMLQWRSDAPVSYPHIWNAGQQALVQWNGVASNSKTKPGDVDPKALGRNTGEVTGVFADVVLLKNKPGKEKLKLKLRSSADVSGLIDLETTLGKLPSPEWPRHLPGFEIDESLLPQGQKIYEDHCQSCHTILSPMDSRQKDPTWLPVGFSDDDLDDKIVMNWITDVGTDIWMACNADQFGVKRDKTTGEILPNQPDYYQGAAMLTIVVKKTLLNAKNVVKIAKAILEGVFAGGGADESAPTKDTAMMIALPPHLEAFPHETPPSARKVDQASTCLTKSQSASFEKLQKKYDEAQSAYKDQSFLKKLFSSKKKKARNAAKEALETHQQLRYKARPLNGIWATAPYLHNGSVPTMEDLLLPPRYNDPAQVFRTRLAPETGTDFRPECFYVGSLEYNPEKMGYESPVCGSALSADSELFKFETIRVGNSNAGHNYPAGGLNEDERKALLEFLKTL